MQVIKCKGLHPVLAVSFLLLAISSGTEGASVAKRSDDSNPLLAVVERLTADVAQLKARLDSMDHHVAFSAQFSADHPATQVSSAFKFDQVTFNDGDAYDPMLGLFTAPFTGVYTFSVQIFTYGAERLVVDIQVNGGLAHRMALDTSLLGGAQHGEDSDSMTVTLRLAQGDRVWVEGFGGQGTATLLGGGHTFFTGALLYAI